MSAQQQESPRRRLSASERAERNAAALERIEQGQSLANYAAIFDGFTARGIPAAEIKPRENVLTFNAWQAKGRYVRKGEKSVKVVTWVPKVDKATGEEIGRYPSTAYVFHITQTEARD